MSPFLDEAHSPRDIGEGSRSFDSVMEELASYAARQSELVAQARAVYAADEEKISSLQAQLSDVQAELASSKAEQLSSKAKLERAEFSAQRLADEKLAMLAELEQQRAAVESQRVNSVWVLKYLQQNRSKHLDNLDEFFNRVRCSLNQQEEKLRKMSIEFDEELYPHLVQSVAERR